MVTEEKSKCKFSDKTLLYFYEFILLQVHIEVKAELCMHEGRTS